MKNECVSGLHALLADMKETALNLPVVIGGIAVTKRPFMGLLTNMGLHN